MRKSIVLLLLAIFLHSCASLSPRTTADNPSGPEALARTFLAMVDTENRTPMNVVDELLLEDFVQCTSIGEIHIGKSPNIRFYSDAVAEVDRFFAWFKSEYRIESVQIIGNTAALSGNLAMSGGEEIGIVTYRREFLESLVFVKVDGKWRLALEHSTRLSTENF
ncbi:MAG: nuclear transport factor 2 family protein [Candidatus Hydrogenedentota bacterium]